MRVNQTARQRGHALLTAVMAYSSRRSGDSPSELRALRDRVGAEPDHGHRAASAGGKLDIIPAQCHKLAGL
jgi:hypothetical protein